MTNYALNDETIDEIKIKKKKTLITNNEVNDNGTIFLPGMRIVSTELG